MARTRAYAGLDIGTTKICAFPGLEDHHPVESEVHHTHFVFMLLHVG